MAKKKRSKKRQSKVRANNIYPIYSSYNPMIHSSINPFYRSSYSPSFSRAPVHRANFMSKLRPDSAVNPFKRFGEDRLGLQRLKNMKKKNLNWEQAKRRFPKLQPFGDADKDGVINLFDCKPFDPKRQDTNIGKAAKLQKKYKEYLKVRKQIEKASDEGEVGKGKKSDLQKLMSKYKQQEGRIKEIRAPITKAREDIQSTILAVSGAQKEIQQKKEKYYGRLNMLDTQIGRTNDQISSLQKQYKKARGQNKTELLKALTQKQDSLSEKQDQILKIKTKAREDLSSSYGKMKEIKELQAKKKDVVKSPEFLRQKLLANIEERKYERAQKGRYAVPGLGPLELGTEGQMIMELNREADREGVYGRTAQAVRLGLDAGTDIKKGFGKAMTKKYSSGMQATSAKAKRATFGIFNALTDTGGLFEDDSSSSYQIGKRGGLARVRQRTSQTRGKVGRPPKTYKYGAPIQQIKAMEREQKRQVAMQQLQAQLRASQMQAQTQQIPIQQPQQQPTFMSTPRSVQMQQQPEAMPQDMMNDNDTMQTFAGPMSTGFITDEMINTPQPQMSQMSPQMQQGPKDMYSRTVPATSLARGNPFNLKAKFRPNLSFNPLKYLQKNLMTGGKPIIQSVSPATTISTRSTTSTNQMIAPATQRFQDQQTSQNPSTSSFTFQNRDESGMLA